MPAAFWKWLGGPSKLYCLQLIRHINEIIHGFCFPPTTVQVFKLIEIKRLPFLVFYLVLYKYFLGLLNSQFLRSICKERGLLHRIYLLDDEYGWVGSHSILIDIYCWNRTY